MVHHVVLEDFQAVSYVLEELDFLTEKHVVEHVVSVEDAFQALEIHQPGVMVEVEDGLLVEGHQWREQQLRRQAISIG